MLPTDPTSKRIRNNAYFAINLSIIRYIPLAKLYQQILSSFTIGTENKTQNNSSIRTIFNNIRQFDD